MAVMTIRTIMAIMATTTLMIMVILAQQDLFVHYHGHGPHGH